LPVVWEMNIEGHLLATILVVAGGIPLSVGIYKIISFGRSKFGWYVADDDIDDRRGSFPHESFDDAVSNANKALGGSDDQNGNG